MISISKQVKVSAIYQPISVTLKIFTAGFAFGLISTLNAWMLNRTFSFYKDNAHATSVKQIRTTCYINKAIGWSIEKKFKWKTPERKKEDSNINLNRKKHKLDLNI